MNSQDILRNLGISVDIQLDSSETYDYEIAGFDNDYDPKLLDFTNSIVFDTPILNDLTNDDPTIENIKLCEFDNRINDVNYIYSGLTVSFNYDEFTNHFNILDSEGNIIHDYENFILNNDLFTYTGITNEIHYFVICEYSDTPVPTSSPTPEPTNTETPTPTETSTPLPSATSTETPLPTLSSTPNPTGTSTPIPTLEPTPNPTSTEAPTPTPNPTSTEIPTPIPTSTEAPTPTPNPTSTNQPTPNPTITIPPTLTPNPTSTVQPTPEPTSTVQPTATPAPTSTVQPTPEPTSTVQPTSTPVPTSTETPLPTATTLISSITLAYNYSLGMGSLSFSGMTTNELGDATCNSLATNYQTQTYYGDTLGLGTQFTNENNQDSNQFWVTNQYYGTPQGPLWVDGSTEYIIETDVNGVVIRYEPFIVQCTPTPTPNPTSTNQPTPVPTSTVQPTPEPTSTNQPTPNPTSTEIPTPIPTNTAEPTATPVPTSTNQPTPNPTVEPTPNPTSTEGPTSTPNPTSTLQPTPNPTSTEAPTPTPNPTSTNQPTPVPTNTAEPTATPVPTSTNQPTPVPTSTVQPTATPAPTSTEAPTPTPNPTSTEIPTPVPTSTVQPTPVPTSTATPTESSAPSPTPQPTSTPNSTPQPTPTATVNLWVPTPDAWFDASDTSSYTLSGSNLTSVTDKVGNFNMSVDGTPTRVSNGLNNKNVWDFGGSESLISSNSGPYSSGGNHWAIGVFQFHTTDSTKDSFWSADGNRTYALSSGNSSSVWYGEIDYDGSNSIVNGKARNIFTQRINQSQWAIVAVIANKTDNEFYGRLNGNIATNVDVYNNSMNGTCTDLRMMRNRAGVKLDGRMAEYFHFASYVGGDTNNYSEVWKAEGYLAHKWGLTSLLPSNHPYKNTQPTV